MPVARVSPAGRPSHRGVGGSGSTYARLQKNLSPESLQRVIRGNTVAKSACPTARRHHTVTAVAEATSVERHYPKREFDEDDARGTVKQKPSSGRPRIHDKEDIEALHDYLKAESFWQNRKLAMKEANRLDGCIKFNIPHVAADVQARLLPAI